MIGAKETGGRIFMKIALTLRPLIFMIIGIAAAHAQDLGTLNPEPLPPLANPNSPSIPARELFARKTTPFAGPARSIGTYNGGCLEGGVALPLAGPAWQVMRLSRDRYWGNPSSRRLYRAAGREGQEGRVERTIDRRHVATPRRTDAQWPFEPSNRP